MASDPFFVTTPIYYVNDAPHIGHALTTVLADVMARYRRLCGDDVLFLTGTDEHGLKIQRAADLAGITPQAMADANSARFKDAWAGLDISNDDFIRTTEPRHKRAVEAFLERVYAAGDIELGTYEGLYCVPCEAYYAPEDLIGQASAASLSDAAAPSDAAAQKNCPIHDRPVEHVVEENYFFKLSRYEQRLLDFHEANPTAVVPASRRNEVLGFIKGGLRDFSVSRTSITWGIPIPWDPKHVAYVWFDALVNYCTAAGFPDEPERFERLWPADVHFVGKDILRFHAVYWPAMLMSAGLDPARQVAAHGWLTVGGEKMSKTKLNAISPGELTRDFGVDGFRYHFTRDQSFGPDGDFSYEAMVERYNADLANNFGNLASRILTMTTNYLNATTPEVRADGPLMSAALTASEALAQGLEKFDFAGGFGAVWDLVRATNAYIEEQRPWSLYKTGDIEATSAILGDCLETLRIIALLASPVIPRACDELWRRLGLEGSPRDLRLPDGARWGGLPGGLKVEKGEPLFPRLDS